MQQCLAIVCIQQKLVIVIIVTLVSSCAFIDNRQRSIFPVDQIWDLLEWGRLGLFFFFFLKGLCPKM